MKRTFTTLFVLIAILTLAVACGDEGEGNTTNYYDDDNDDTSDDDATPDDDDTSDDDTGDDDDDDTTPTTISGHVVSFPHDFNVSGLTVELVADGTIEPLDPPVTTTVGTDGSFALEPPIGVTSVGVRSGIRDIYKYTVVFGVTPGTSDVTIYINHISGATWVAVFDETPYDWDKGAVFGVVEWNGESVGCATATADRSGGAASAIAYPDAESIYGLDSTDPTTGWFVGLGFTPQDYAFEATAGDETAYSEVLPVFLGHFTQYTVRFTGASNPTPNDCQ